MPRRPIFTKEEFVQKSFEFVQKNGIEALSARDLGAYMGTSSRPIFSFFNSMDELKEAINQKAREYFCDYVKDSVEYFPAFKEFGRRIITFAREEHNLFMLLFLSENPYKPKEIPTLQSILESMEKEYEITKEECQTLFEQNWIFICGLITICHRSSFPLSEEEINQRMTRQFMANLLLIKSNHELNAITPHLRQPEEQTSLPFGKKDK
ncbi:MAG: hypothetical protein MJZ81_02540 [Bacteroidales bacterium]|nr:hypothetical protein [Bacteroidales bacterium]